MSAATTFSAVAQQISASLGVSIAAIILQLARPTLASPPSAYEFHIAFATLASIVFLSVLGFLRLPPEAGRQLVHASERQAPDRSMAPHGRE